MPPGCPTKYKPEYCQGIIDFMQDGATLVEYAAKIKVNPDTIYEWSKVIPKFSEAFREARAASEAWWAKLAREHSTGKEGNAALIKFNMSARFGWSEKTEVKQSVTVSYVDALRELAKDD